MSYSLTATATSITFHVTHIDGYNYYRLFLRKNSDNNMILDGVGITKTGDFTYTASGLEPNVKYVANVYYRVGSDTTDDFIVIGSQTITTPDSDEETRPTNWAWESSISSGSPISITATEWNNFCRRINSFRTYIGLGRYSFTEVSSGMKISASICNEAWSAINPIVDNSIMPNKAVAGGNMYASFFTKLCNALNSIN